MRIGIVYERIPDTNILLQAVALTPEHHVIWIGASGADAVELCARETPDLILIDSLTGLDAVEATRRIMANTPCAILIVTGSLHVKAATVLEAVGHGALDVVEMPAPGTGTLQERAVPLLTKLATISRLLGERDAARRLLALSTSTNGC